MNKKYDRKKIRRTSLAVLVVLSLLVSIVSPGIIPKMVYASQTNLLDNPGFEDGTAGWEIGDTFSIVDEVARTGSKSLAFTRTAGTWQSTRQIIQVEQNTEYIFEVYAKGDAQIHLAAMTTDWSVRLKEVYATPNTSEWTRYSLEFNSEDNTQVMFYLGEITNGTSYFDDARAVRKEVAPPPGIIQVENPSFEDGAAGWEMGSNFSVTDRFAKTGSKSLTFTRTEVSWQSATQVIDVESNTDYVFTVHGKVYAEENTELHIAVMTVNWSQRFKEVYAKPDTEEWNAYQVEFNSGDNTQVRIFLGENGIGTGFYDDVSVVRKDVVPPTMPERGKMPTGPRLKDIAGVTAIGVRGNDQGTNTELGKSIILREFNSVQPTWYFAWGGWTAPDTVQTGTFNGWVNWALDNNLKHLTMHQFVGPNFYLPDWLVEGTWTTDQLDQMLENAIRRVLEDNDNGEKVDVWNVANEMFRYDQSGMYWPDDEQILNQLGWEADRSGIDSADKINTQHPVYIRKAFEYARKYAPSAKLEIRECELDFVPNSTKGKAFYQLVKHLVEAGVPIDAVGLQGHVGNMSQVPDWDGLKENIQRFKALGLEVYLTEIDVGDTTPWDDTKASKQKDFYQKFITVAREAGVDAIYTWGLVDGDPHWRTHHDPLLFDADFNPKPAYYGVQNALINTGLFSIQARGAKGGERIQLKLDDVVAAEWYVSKSYTEYSYLGHTKGAKNIKIEFVNAEDGGSVEVDSLKVQGTTYAAEDYDTTANDHPSRHMMWNGVIDFGTIDPVVYDPSIQLDERDTSLKQSQIVYGTVTVDGEIDEVWQSAITIRTDRHIGTISDGSTAEADVRTLWDEDYLYILFEVYDPYVTVASPNFWEKDAVELFFDETNAKSTGFHPHSIQIRVNAEGEVTSEPQANMPEGFLSVVVPTDNGYRVECAIPWYDNTRAAEGHVIGFDAQVNDDINGDGKREGVAVWNDLTGTGWQGPAVYGVMELVTTARLTPVPNLLTNSGFENGGTGWQIDVGSNFSVTEDQILTGTKALKFTRTTESWGSVRQTIDVDANTDYIFEVYAKGNAQFHLAAMTPSWGRIAEKYLTANHENWTKFTLEFNSGANSQVMFYLGEISNGTTYLDNTYAIKKADLPGDPIITLKGRSDIELYVGEEYVEQGATARDAAGNTLNVSIRGTVNTQKTGIYQITYWTIDSNNRLASATRTVKVSRMSSYPVEATGADASVFEKAPDYICYVDPQAGDDSSETPGDDSTPFRTVGKALEFAKDKLAENESVQIILEDGVYTENLSSVIRIANTDGYLIIEARNPGKAILSGSEDWSASKNGESWTYDADGRYYKTWDKNWGFDYAATGSGGSSPDGSNERDHLFFSAISRAELVMYQDTIPLKIVGAKSQMEAGLRQFGSLDEMTENTMYIDDVAGRMYIRLMGDANPNDPGHKVEVSVTRSVKDFWPDGVITLELLTNVKIKGIQMRHGAGATEASALKLTQCNNIIIEDCSFVFNGGRGVELYECNDVTLTDSDISSNGSGGFLPNGRNMRIQRLQANENNFKGLWAGFTGWSTAGMKACWAQVFLVEDSFFMNNHAPGLWFDIDGEDIIVRNSVMKDNYEFGLFLEISPGPFWVEGCEIIGNNDAGIQIERASIVTVKNNRIENNEHQIMIAQWPDRSVPYSTDLVFENNQIIGYGKQRLVTRSPYSNIDAYDNTLRVESKFINNTFVQNDLKEPFTIVQYRWVQVDENAFMAYLGSDKLPPRQPKESLANYGTPMIDGEIDEIWNDAEEILVDTQLEAMEDTAYGKSKMLWDEGYLYILTQVTDDYITTASVNPWEKDSVEIFIDEDSSRGSSYDGVDDGQYRIDVDNIFTGGGSVASGKVDDIRSAVRIVEGGYLIEAAIPWSRPERIEIGMTIGFDVQINDDANGNGSRDGAAVWNAYEGTGWSSAAVFGKLTLVEAGELPGENDGRDNDDSPGNTGNTGSTGNTGNNQNIKPKDQDTNNESEVADEVKDSTSVPTLTINFHDLSGHWAEESISKLAAKGIVNGYPDGSFKPKNKITRAEFVTLIVRTFALSTQEGKSFGDTATHWAKDNIAAAAFHGIVGGYGDGSFGPNDFITREDMVVMIVRAAKLDEVAEDAYFVDYADVSGYAKKAVATAAGKGIINGYQGNRFIPQGVATRAEAITVIARIVGLE